MKAAPNRSFGLNNQTGGDRAGRHSHRGDHNTLSTSFIRVTFLVSL